MYSFSTTLPASGPAHIKRVPKQTRNRWQKQELLHKNRPEIDAFNSRVSLLFLFTSPIFSNCQIIRIHFFVLQGSQQVQCVVTSFDGFTSLGTAPTSSSCLLDVPVFILFVSWYAANKTWNRTFHVCLLLSSIQRQK